MIFLTLPVCKPPSDPNKYVIPLSSRSLPTPTRWSALFTQATTLCGLPVERQRPQRLPL